ncbi:hypothetical protein B0A49_13313 [Cryomyces minteri]|uniref:Uncharacterized protein n=1 Tax=Cryomyces minteri TaxID=331657 RepID=A0A4U0WR26_9PEZI|nr:hypothetical protein B0A49_13313 [Cryomyces minteri]
MPALTAKSTTKHRSITTNATATAATTPPFLIIPFLASLLFRFSRGSNAEHGVSGRAEAGKDVGEINAIEDERDDSVNELGDTEKQEQPGRGSREVVEEAYAGRLRVEVVL